MEIELYKIFLNNYLNYYIDDSVNEEDFFDYNKPIEKHITKINYKLNQPIKTGFFQNHIKEIVFNSKFNYEIKYGDLPDNIKKITLGIKYDKPFNDNIFPKSLKELKIMGHFNFSIPSTIKKLYIQNTFNSNSIPNTIDILELGFMTVLNIGDIPYGIKELILHSYNDILTKNILPNSLTKLIFSDLCNFKININSIPNSVKYLNLGSYNDTLTNILPSNLIHLELGDKFNQRIEVNILPQSLKYLKFGSNYGKQLLNGVLPNNLETLIFHHNHGYIYPFLEGQLPNSLKHLEFPNYIRLMDNIVLPKNITFLKFGEKFKGGIKEGDIPKSVKTLIFGRKFNQLLRPNIIPYGVEKIIFSWEFNQELNKDIIPNSVIDLTFENYNQKLKIGDIPNSVKNLKIGSNYKYPLTEGIIPSSVIRLYLPMSYSGELSKTIIPNVKYLTCHRVNNLNPDIISLTLHTYNDYTSITNYKNNFYKGKYLIGYIDKTHHRSYNGIDYDDIFILGDYVNKINELIDENFIKEKYIGNIIKEELIEKVFNPNRLLKICGKYNIDFFDLIECY